MVRGTHLEVHTAPNSTVATIPRDIGPRRITEGAQLHRGADVIGTHEVRHLLCKRLQAEMSVDGLVLAGQACFSRQICPWTFYVVLAGHAHFTQGIYTSSMGSPTRNLIA